MYTDAARDGDAPGATPTTAWCAASVESVEIDKLMGRILAVMVVPYPPGIPVIMPGERLTKATQVDSGLPARTRASSTTKFPGFETDIHGLRFEPTAAAGGATWWTA